MQLELDSRNRNRGVGGGNESYLQARGIVDFGGGDREDWRYIEKPEERNYKVLCYWQTKKGYDIVMVTVEPVNVD